MIRNKRKIFGEANDERTVLTVPDKLAPNKFVTRLKESNEHPDTSRIITTLGIESNSLLILSESDKIEPFKFSGPGRIIGTDDKGNVIAFERRVLPPSPPKGRTLILEKYGSTRPDGIVINLNEYLSGPYWYEVEVSGCGGGGGSGSGLAEHDDLVDGMSGGAGGYFKGTFQVREDTICIIQIGCPGEGAQGYITDYTSKTAKLTQGPNGGAGGYTPTKYMNSKGNDGQKQDLTRRNQTGGTGINGGASGGTVYGWKTDSYPESYSGAGAGGGANGECGGAGGNSGPFGVSDATMSNVPHNGNIGGAGGAGAGFGTGGAGGNGWSKATEKYGNGGKGYGAGGGGGCQNATDAQLQKVGCGGGGGGGARFVCNDFEVLCGGGGGGSGGCDIESQHSDGRHKGQDGGNNKNSTRGGGASGGTGGKGVSTNMKVTRNTSGTTGSRGWIKIWRCE